MTDAARPASQHRFASASSRAPEQERDVLPTSAQTLQPARPSPPPPSAPDKTPVVWLPTTILAAFRPRRHLSDPSAILKSP